MRPASFQVYWVVKTWRYVPPLGVFKVACFERSSPYSRVYNQPTDRAVMIPCEVALDVRSSSWLCFVNLVKNGEHLQMLSLWHFELVLLYTSELRELKWRGLSTACCPVKLAIGDQRVQLQPLHTRQSIFGPVIPKDLSGFCQGQLSWSPSEAATTSPLSFRAFPWVLPLSICQWLREQLAIAETCNFR